MDIQRELNSIKGAIEMQEGIYVPLKEVERMLINRIQQVENNSVLEDVTMPNGTLCLSCEKAPATRGIGDTKTVCAKCWDNVWHVEH